MSTSVSILQGLIHVYIVNFSIIAKVSVPYQCASAFLQPHVTKARELAAGWLRDFVLGLKIRIKGSCQGWQYRVVAPLLF